MTGEHLNTLSLLLKTQGIETVAIIDDAYDDPVADELAEVTLDDFWANVQADMDVMTHFETLGLTIPQPGTGGHAEIEVLIKNRLRLGPAQHIWNKFIAPVLDTKARHLDPLVEKLESLNLKVNPFKSTAIEQVGYHHIIFLDYNLGPTPSKQAREKAKQRAVELQARFEKNLPLLVLMSSSRDVLSAEDAFRKESSWLGGSFYCMHKDELLDPFGFALSMHMFAVSMANGRTLQAFVNSLSNKMMSIGNTFVKHIKELTLADYCYLHQLSLEAEGQPLGEYAFEAFADHLNYLLFGKALGKERVALDGLTFEHFVPVRALPSLRLNDVYIHTVHEMIDDDLRHPWGRAKEPESPAEPSGAPLTAIGSQEVALVSLGAASEMPERASNVTERSTTGIVATIDSSTWPYLARGDVFLEKKSGEVTRKAYVVINAPCDLARRGDPTESILLVEGTLREFGGRDQDEKEGKAKGKSKLKEDKCPETVLFQYKAALYRVVWRVKHVASVPYEEFATWRNERDPDNGFKRVARLRPAHAHEIQQAFAANLTRGGKSAATQYYRRATTKLFRAELRDKTAPEGKAETKTKRSFVEVALDTNEQAFLLQSMSENKTRCVLTAQLICKIRDTAMSVSASLQERVADDVAKDRPHTDDTEAWLKLTAPMSVSVDGKVTGPGGKELVLPPVMVVRRNFELTPGWNPPKGVAVLVIVNDGDATTSDEEQSSEHE